MDSTVIDSFVVELGLDPSKFNKQQKETIDNFKKTQDEAVRGANAIEEQSRRSGDFISQLKGEAIKLFAVFSGGKGAVNFALGLTHADAAVGRLSRSTDVSAKTISAWQGAATIFGGDAKSMASSITTLSDAFAGWKIGIISPLVADFRAISTAGGTLIDMNKGVEQSMLDLSANLKAIHDVDPARAGLLGRKVGLDPGLLDLMIKGPKALKEVLDYVNKIGTATKSDTDAFGELEKRINQMGLKAESLGRKVLGGEGGGAQTIIGTADWLNKPAGEAAQDVIDAYKEQFSRSGGFGGFMKDLFTFNWQEHSAPKKPINNLFTPVEEPARVPTPTRPEALRPSSGSVFSSQKEKEEFIRETAIKNKIDPDRAVQVAKTEGFYTFNSSIPGEKSYGAFQLNISKNPNKPSLGDMFKRDTNLDPSDPKNERLTIEYALKHASTSGRGWADWYGARNNGIPQFAGIPARSDRTSQPSTLAPTLEAAMPLPGPRASPSTLPPLPGAPPPLPGALPELPSLQSPPIGAAAAASISEGNTTKITNETNIENLNLQTQATDGTGAAKDFRSQMLKRQQSVALSNTGQQ